MNCDPELLKNVSTMPEFLDNMLCKGRFVGDSVSSACKPCQHAILDVWGGAEEELDRLKKVVEPGGPLGLTSSQGWFISFYVYFQRQKEGQGRSSFISPGFSPSS